MPKLPDSVQMIADVIGEDAALELVRRWPRQPDKRYSCDRIIVSIPKRPTTSSRLVAILGWDNAAKLSREFGGEVLTLATCANLRRNDRDQAIARALANNATPAAISLRFGLNERHVRRIAARLRAEAAAIPAMGTRNLIADHPRDSGPRPAA